MRSVILDAAMPRPLRWQAALTNKPYQALSPVIWQHRFISDKPMTNWTCGVRLSLIELNGNGPVVVKRALTRSIRYTRS